MSNHSRARDAGFEWERENWGFEKPRGLKDFSDAQIQIALQTAILSCLNKIVMLLECPNVSQGFQSMKALERLAREYWIKPRRRKKKVGAK